MRIGQLRSWIRLRYSSVQRWPADGGSRVCWGDVEISRLFSNDISGYLWRILRYSRGRLSQGHGVIEMVSHSSKCLRIAGGLH